MLCCHAQVVYPALDSKVKNVTLAYSVEHEDEVRGLAGRAGCGGRFASQSLQPLLPRRALGAATHNTPASATPVWCGAGAPACAAAPAAPLLTLMPLRMPALCPAGAFV